MFDAENETSSPKKGWRFVRWCLIGILLLVLAGVSLATVVVTSRFWWQQELNGPPASSTTLSELDEKLQTLDERADELEKLVTLLLGVSTIYAIALALNAYQQMKDSKVEIRQQLKESKEEIDKFVTKVERKYPLFANMNTAFGDIMEHLMELLPAIDWSEGDYNNLTEHQKQEILFYEKTVASFEYFNFRRSPRACKTVSEIYHGLGNFYGLKYEAEGKLRFEDKERSRFYLDRAIDYDGKNVGALNDRGFLAMSLDKPPACAKAREVFTKSLETDEGQQRALYDLACVEMEEKAYDKAVDLLTQALEKDHWQAKLPPRHLPSIYYNRACSYARLGDSNRTRKTDLYEKAVQDLEEAFSPGAGKAKELPSSFDTDIRQNGDLYLLTQETRWSKKIEEIRSRLTSKQNPPAL